MRKENLNNDFSKELDYVIKNLEKNIKETRILEDKIYFELSKQEIINYFNDSYKIIKEWLNYYKTSNYELISNEYKQVEANISELELCLADYEDIFHMNGISYALFEIGKKLCEIRKESDKNGR